MLVGLNMEALNGRKGRRYEFLKSGQGIGRYRVELEGNEVPTGGNFWPTNIKLLEVESNTVGQNNNDVTMQLSCSLPSASSASSVSSNGLDSFGDFGDHVEARDIHGAFRLSEEHLKKKHKEQRTKSRRRTDVRIAARKKLKQTKAFSRVAMFQHLNQDIISKLVDKCEFARWKEGDVICKQGAPADCLYVVAFGECKVLLRKSDMTKHQHDSDSVQQRRAAPAPPSGIPPILSANANAKGNKVEDEQPEEEMQEVCRLGDNDFFGESSLLGVGPKGVEIAKIDSNKRIRNATIQVVSPMLDTLALSRQLFCSLLASGDLDDSVVDNIKSVRNQRNEADRKITTSTTAQAENSTENAAPLQTPTPEELELRENKKLTNYEKKYLGGGKSKIVGGRGAGVDLDAVFAAAGVSKREEDLAARESTLKDMEEQHRTTVQLLREREEEQQQTAEMMKQKHEQHEQVLQQITRERTKHAQTLSELETLRVEHTAMKKKKSSLSGIQEDEEKDDGHFRPSFDVKARLALMKASRSGNSRMSIDVSEFQNLMKSSRK